MPQSLIPFSSSDARRPGRSGTDGALGPVRRRQVRRWVATVAPAVCTCVGCSYVAAYGGSASLQVSGVAGDQLAFQTVTFTRCRGSTLRQARGDTTSENDRIDVFTIVALGDDCLFYAEPGWKNIQPGPRNLCSLAFPDGTHTLRVTDYAFIFPGARYEGNSVVIRIGGDEVASSRHAIYQFSGSAVAHADEYWRCDGIRQRPGSDGG